MPDLKEMFGDRYRVQRSPEDGLLYLPCPTRQAEIYLHSETELAVHFLRTAQPNATAKSVMAKVPRARVTQIADFEVILVCPLADALELFRACGAARKRRLTDDQRLASAERLKQFQFPKPPARQRALEPLELPI